MRWWWGVNKTHNFRSDEHWWTDVTETDDIERIRQHRNIMAHNTDFKISDSDFNVIWLELSQVCPSFGYSFQSGLYFKRPSWPRSHGCSNYICPSMLITPEVVSFIHAPSPSQKEYPNDGHTWDNSSQITLKSESEILKSVLWAMIFLCCRIRSISSVSVKWPGSGWLLHPRDGVRTFGVVFLISL
jgi:hypothetical protein